MKGFFLFFLCLFQVSVFHIVFFIISKSFATHRCCHSCSFIKHQQVNYSEGFNKDVLTNVNFLEASLQIDSLDMEINGYKSPNRIKKIILCRSYLLDNDSLNQSIKVPPKGFKSTNKRAYFTFLPCICILEKLRYKLMI